MAGPGDIVSPFIIRELTGDEREVRLVGRALPYRPYSLEGEQRAEFTWYAGSPVATVQPLGAEEMDTTINGMWKDRFIREFVGDPANPVITADQVSAATLNGLPIDSVVDLSVIIDDIRRKGQLIEVIWLHTARRGLLTRFRQTWHTGRDLEWEITFKWSSQGDEQGIQNAIREDDFNDVANRQAGEAERLNRDASPALGVGLDETFADNLNRRVTQIQSATRNMNESVLEFVDGALAPLDAGRRMLGLLDFVRNESELLTEDLYAQTDRGIQQTEDLIEFALIPLAQVVSNAAANRRIIRQSRRMRHTASRDRIRVARTIEPDLLAVFFARDNDDLRNVSLDFYGTANEWPRLRTFNNLRTSLLVAGQVVLVPQRDNL